MYWHLILQQNVGCANKIYVEYTNNISYYVKNSWRNQGESYHRQNAFTIRTSLLIGDDQPPELRKRMN